MRKYSFALELPTGTTLDAAYQVGLEHVAHPVHADYACLGARKSKTPGKRTFSYSYVA